MTYTANPSAMVAIASGAAIFALGAAVLVVGLRAHLPRASRAPAVAFGAFLITWGAQIGVANTANLAADPATVVPWAHANAVLSILLAEALAILLLLYPTPRPAARQASAWILVTLPAAVFLLVYAQQPELMVKGASWSHGYPRLDPGPLDGPVSILAVLGLFVVFLAVMGRALFTTRDDATRRQAALLTAALMCYVSYKAAELATLILPAWRAVMAAISPADAASVVLAVAGAAMVLAVVLWHAARIPQTPWRGLLLLAGTLPAAAAVGEYALVAAGFNSVKTSGIWRLGSAALMTYAVVRFRLFDVELRLWRLVPPVGYLALTGSALALLWARKGHVLSEVPALGAVASASVVAAMVPMVRASRQRVIRLLDHPDRREAVDLRRLEVYGAALAAIGPDAETDPWLRQLRRQLGVTPAEHGLVAALASSPRLLNQGRQQSLQPGEVVGGRYRCEGRINEGGHCIVHKAVDLRSGNAVVLKELRPEQRHDAGMRIRLAREVAALEGFDDPNVVRLLDVVNEGGCPLLVLEFLTGGSLAKLMAGGPLPPATAAGIASDILAGLQRLHARGIVHRDIKPANILLNASGRAKVADLGIARLANEDSAGLTQVGQHPGTPSYMSPEQARGALLDGRSDLYAAGVVLYEMATGRQAEPARPQGARPGRGKTPFDLAGLPAPLSGILRRALATEPEGRYPNAESFHAALAPLLKDGDPMLAAVPDGVEPKLPPTEVVRRRRRANARHGGGAPAG